jgi:hypothetical protein
MQSIVDLELIALVLEFLDVVKIVLELLDLYLDLIQY